MPWKETGPMDERVRFISAHQSGLYSVAELCRQYGISRKTAYKWLDRYAQDGPQGLHERSRAPHTCSHKTPEQVRQALVQMRRAHPHWGAKKLLRVLAEQQPQLRGQLPAPSTATSLLAEEGLVEHKRKSRAAPAHKGSGALVAEAPNDVWCADYKGEFLTGSGALCYPLTITDAFSRYLLECSAQVSNAHEHTFAAFSRLFHEFGCPAAIRTDNGVPFCGTNTLCGLSRLNIWWLKLGIVHQRIRRGCPQQNGRHERMHRTLKAETARPPAADLPAQQGRFDAFRQEYNHVRPHEALALDTPASHWQPSRQCLPKALPEPEYGGHMQVRRVSSSGTFRFGCAALFLTDVLAGEYIALEEVDEDIWSVYFYNALLARLHKTEQGKIKVVPAGAAIGAGAVITAQVQVSSISAAPAAP